MTDLTTEELRAACEAASLDSWYSATHGQRVGVLSDSGREEWSLPEDHLTFPAYVASLLETKIKGLGHPTDSRYYNALPGRYVEQALLATPSQKIRAAMEVLNND